MIVKLQERSKCDWVNMVSEKIKMVLDDSLRFEAPGLACRLDYEYYYGLGVVTLMNYDVMYLITLVLKKK